MKSVLAVLFLFHASFTTGYRILGIVPTPSYSHQVAFQPLWAELSQRGHQVVTLTTNPINDPTLTNLTEIDLNFAYQILIKHDIQEKLKHSQDDPIGFIKSWSKLVEDVSVQELEHPDVQGLLQNETEHFDVVMAEALYPAMFAFSERFNCPLIGILSLEASYYLHRVMGNPAHPVLYPEFTLPFQGKLGFRERIKSTIYQVFMEYFRGQNMNPRDQRLIETYFPNNTSTRDELEQSISMIFTNVNPIFYGNRPLGPNTITFGGGTHLKEKKKLPEDIERWLDVSNEGVIYFSLGSNVKSTDIEDSFKHILMEVFRELPYKILWKFESDELEGKPDNVKIVQWLPQQDVLRHKNIKLFMTQGGLQSMEEAIFSHVPMVAMPFFADQISNAMRMADKKMGIYLNKKLLTKEELKSAIIEVITNNKYRDTVKELAELSQDQPMSGLDKAVWWTEYVVRNKGAKHFVTPGRDIPLYQHLLLDVIGFFAAFALIFLFVASFVLKKTWKLLMKLVIKEETKTKAE